MNRRLLGATLLAGGLCALLPGLGIAQAPPIQDNPQARDHVLRLPPSYNPSANAPSNGDQAPRYDGTRYAAPQYGPSGGQPTYQGGPAPRYGGSLLGAPNAQTPGYGAPSANYGYGQPANPGYGGSQPGGQPQTGSGIPPVQSPRYAPPPGEDSAYGPVSQPNPYVRPDTGAQPYGSQDPSISQEPLAPLPDESNGPQQQQPPGQTQDTLPAASQPAGQQSSSPVLAAPQVPQGSTASPPPAGTEAQKAPAPAPAPDLPNIWLPAGVAKLQALDKVNAQASTISVKVGQSVTFGSLTITVKSCVIRPPDQPADAAAFVDVTDSHPDSTGFSGWLLENEPSVSIMQHPIYDLRVTGCA